MATTTTIGCRSSSKARRPAAASVAAPLLFKLNCCFFLTTCFTLLLITPIVRAQEMSWYVSWTAGKLCDKKPSASIETWETSYTTLQACCDEKFSYDYDNCCNPTFPGLESCFEESCKERTCTNGLYSDSACTCLCVPAYTLDSAGDCTTKVGGGVIENPFASCTINVDCPWWSDPMRLEKCDSGSEIPDGIYTLDWTREECCKRHHPDSKYCNVEAAEGGGSGGDPDDFVDLSLFEVIPVKFSISNLPDDDTIDITNLKEKVRNVLKDVVLGLTRRVTDLGVSSVQETTRFFGDEGGENQLGGIDVYYDVKVIRVPDQEFAPLIIQEVIDSYENILEDIQDYVLTQVYVNICMEDDSALEGSSLFNMCTLQAEEVTIKFRFKDLPQEIVDNTKFFDNIKMEIMEAYKELLTDDDDASIDGMILLSILDKGDVSLPDGIIDVSFGILVRSVNGDVTYASAIEEKITSSRQVIVDRIQKVTDKNPNRNVNWCTKEKGALTVCTPGEVAALAKPFPPWKYAVIVIGCLVGVIVLIFLCRVCKCEGFASCVHNRKISRGRTRKAEAINQLNMESYIFSGRPAQRRSSTKRRRSSFASEHDRGVMRRRSSSSGERYDGRRRYDKERRRPSHSHRRERRQSQRRSSSRKRRSRRMTTDSDNFSVSSLDAKKQENQIVLYEGAQTQPLAICDDEEKQAKKPDPDGVSVNVFMLKGVNSITTNVKEEDNDEMLLEEDADGRFISFKV